MVKEYSICKIIELVLHWNAINLTFLQEETIRGMKVTISRIIKTAKICILICTINREKFYWLRFIYKYI